MRELTGFIAADTAIEKWADLQPYYERLLESDPKTTAELETLILQYNDTASVFGEQYAWAYINMTCHTDRQDYLKRYEVFSTQIEPEVSKAGNLLDTKIVTHPCFGDLDTQRYGQYQRHLKCNLALFREENVALNAQIAQLSTRFEQVSGALTVTIDGEEMTLPRAGVRLKSADRQIRETAWRAIQSATFSVKDQLDGILDEMIALRHQKAVNAGYENFRDFQHDYLHRFDYKPADALAFHDAVEKFIVPLAKNLLVQRQIRLGIKDNDFRPWDMQGEPQGQEPLKPFESSSSLIENAISIFDQLHPQFGENLRAMQQSNLLDLESRKHKAPGGYNLSLDVTGMPFIFMNAAGTQRDVVTMMHEGGHAMHTFLTNDEPLVQYRETPSEMAETASMAMELMTRGYWSKFYNDADFKRARREHLEGIIKFFPWCATIDAFQHWLYCNPEHTSAERDEHFLHLQKRFGTGLVNWEGFENYHVNAWQRQLHIFSVPFYYIEYGIAQLGALQVYHNYLKDPDKALKGYIRGLSLGASIPLPDIWRQMGIKFDFSADTLSRLMDSVSKELQEITE